MRLAILTGDGLEQQYIASVLADAFPDALGAIVIAKPDPKPLRATISRHVRRYNARQLCSRTIAKLYGSVTGQQARRRETFLRLFSGGERLSIPRSDVLRTVPSHNGKECEALLQEMRPDIIAVYGTAVIKPHIIRLAAVCALNMHTGLSPRYRGSDTVFWPLYNREPEWIGVTVHVLDEGIDSGPIIATGRPKITADDDEHSLFAKCVMVGARLYVDAIRRVAAGPLDLGPQDLNAGRQYRFVDRTVWAERRVRRYLREGLLARFSEQSE